jgi:hypothetical protein
MVVCCLNEPDALPLIDAAVALMATDHKGYQMVHFREINERPSTFMHHGHGQKELSEDVMLPRALREREHELEQDPTLVMLI